MKPLLRALALAPALVACVPASLPAQQSAGQKYAELLRRIPEQANLLMFVDVDSLFDSPLGRREKWREEATARGKARLGLPTEIARVAVAAGVDLDEFHEDWRVGMAEIRGKLPDLETLAAREGGFVEPINLAKVVWTPRDLYFITFEPRILGFATPAWRQRMAKWITTTFVKPRTFPPGFASKAIVRAEGGSQVVLALNVADAISPPLAAPRLAEMDSIKKYRIDPRLLAERLATAKLAFLQVDVDNAIKGTIRVEFESDMDYAKPVAKELVLTALSENGADLPELARWSGGVEGRAIELSGPLSEDSLRLILSLARPPQLTPARQSLGDLPASAEGGQPSPPKEAAKADVVQASQIYFRSVADMLESLKRQKSDSYHGMKVWYERYAKQIDELPILGVDKELLDWGSTVGRTLREMAYGINYNVQDRKYARSTSGGGYYGGYGYYGASNAPQETIRQQGEAQLSVGLDGKWQLLNTSIGDMRRKMVDKYQVDF